MATYTYTHGSTLAKDRLRLLIGDHRGTGGVSTGWLFSDEELGDILTICSSSSSSTSVANIQAAMAICLMVRANREAMAAGVAGTTDTTDRPAALIQAIRATRMVPIPGASSAVISDNRDTDDDPLTGRLISDDLRTDA